MQEEPANPLMRKKKTPEELAKEAEMEEEDEFTSKGNVIFFTHYTYLYKYECVCECICLLCTLSEPKTH